MMQFNVWIQDPSCPETLHRKVAACVWPQAVEAVLRLYHATGQPVWTNESYTGPDRELSALHLEHPWPPKK